MRHFLLSIGTLFVLAGCAGVPEPLPTPRAFLSPMQYLPQIGSTFSGGKGLGLTYRNCADARAVGARWIYDWSGNPTLCDGLWSLPMIYGWSAGCPVVASGAVTLLPNEPDWWTNMTPEVAAEFTWRMTQECFPERVFATPATYGNVAWMDAWHHAHIDRYGAPPRTAYLALHIYCKNTADHCLYLGDDLLAWARDHGYQQVLITEWAVLPCDTTSEQAIVEAERFRIWLAAQPEIKGDAWFAARIRGDEAWAFQPPTCNTATVDSSGELTTFGRWYAR